MTEERDALVGLAAEIFAGRTSNEQLAAIERSEARWDAELWRELAEAGLLGIAVGEEHGGAGLGLTEVALLLEQQGRYLASIPLWETLTAALLLDGQAAKEWLPRVAAGEARLSVAPAFDGSDGLVTGPFDAIVSVEGSIVVLATDVEAHPVETTTHALAYDVSSASSAQLDVPVARVQDLVRLALSSVQLGVAEAGVYEAAKHLTGREQFGRSLATFQATQQQLADCYCDVQAMRATLGQAVFTQERRDIDVATWWATDAGERIQHTVQHVHGGLGADVTYPVHRRLLWTMRTNALLGGPSRQLVRLGTQLV
ncbi:MAG: acyl-CoA dehydrogenase [Frankiales bacterium]|nr:acyl-CoA dehydrogenase [Frankiales bacterium]